MHRERTNTKSKPEIHSKAISDTLNLNEQQNQNQIKPNAILLKQEMEKERMRAEKSKRNASFLVNEI